MKKLVVFGLIALVLVVLGYYFNIVETLPRILNWIEDQGILGVIVFALIYIGATVAFIPGSILTLGAGAIYGVFQGSIIVSISSTVGASLAFLIGRFFARDWVKAKAAQNSQFNAIDKAVAKEGWKIIGLLRLVPLMPFNLSNYLFSVTGVSFWGYLLASWIGMIPGTVMYVYFGSLIGEIGNTDTAGVAGPERFIIWGLAGVAIVLVSVIITRIAKKALNEKIS
jgi:uncharacterized membrane protein YdjX (TVP38/TMEM64 family)